MQGPLPCACSCMIWSIFLQGYVLFVHAHAAGTCVIIGCCQTESSGRPHSLLDSMCTYRWGQAAALPAAPRAPRNQRHQRPMQGGHRQGAGRGSAPSLGRSNMPLAMASSAHPNQAPQQQSRSSAAPPLLPSAGHPQGVQQQQATAVVLDDEEILADVLALNSPRGTAASELLF